MFIKKTKILAVLGLLAIIVVAPGVMAQETEALAEPEQPTVDSTVNNDGLIKLRADYRLQIESYRQAEREFAIAKDQYKRLQTLRLLEEAVKSTQKVMFERTRVLITYLEIVHFTLQNTQGINLDHKAAAIKELEDQINTLRSHLELIEQSVSREDVAARAVEFEELNVRIESTAYRGMSLIAIGDLQTINDKARLIFADLKGSQSEDEVSELTKASRQRAYVETERILDNNSVLLREINEAYGRQSNPRKSYYDGLVNKLEPVYTGLSQGVSYLYELLKL